MCWGNWTDRVSRPTDLVKQGGADDSWDNNADCAWQGLRRTRITGHLIVLVNKQLRKAMPYMKSSRSAARGATPTTKPSIDAIGTNEIAPLIVASAL